MNERCPPRTLTIAEVVGETGMSTVQNEQNMSSCRASHACDFLFYLITLALHEKKRSFNVKLSWEQKVFIDYSIRSTFVKH